MSASSVPYMNCDSHECAVAIGKCEGKRGEPPWINMRAQNLTNGSREASSSSLFPRLMVLRRYDMYISSLSPAYPYYDHIPSPRSRPFHQRPLSFSLKSADFFTRQKLQSRNADALALATVAAEIMQLHSGFIYAGSLETRASCVCDSSV